MKRFAILPLIVGGLTAGASAGGPVAVDSPPIVRASTSSLRNPLDTRVSIHLSSGTLRSLLEEISNATALEFTVVGGLEQCHIAAFVKDHTARELLQLLLETKALTYQRLGRSNHYTISSSRNIPECPPPANDHPLGTCSGGVPPVSIDCKAGKLAAFAELLHDQAGVNTIVWNEATTYPISTNLRQVTVAEALNRLQEDKALAVLRVGSEANFVMKMVNPKMAVGPSTRKDFICIGSIKYRPFCRKDNQREGADSSRNPLDEMDSR